MKQLLQEIGLTPSEITVYLALLDLGLTTRGAIVHASGIAGSKVYDVLQRLEEKGLVSVYTQNNVKHFKALSPKQILYYLEQKKQKIMKLEEETTAALPKLLAKFAASAQEQEVELLTGLKGLELFFRDQVDSLKKGEYNYVIGGSRGSIDPDVVAFFKKIHLMREEKKIVTKMLYNGRERTYIKREFSKKEYPSTQTRFIQHDSPVAINIHKDRVLISVYGDKVFAVNIKNDVVAKSFKQHFDLLWAQSKE